MSKKPKRLIPNFTNLPQGRIPNNATIISEDNKKYLISFAHYNETICELKELEKNRSQECIRVLKRISKATLGNLREQNVDHLPIANSGEYKKLHYRLPSPDTEIFEHKLQADSRIFYFTISNRFYVVAIKNSHFETDKVRR